MATTTQEAPKAKKAKTEKAVTDEGAKKTNPKRKSSTVLDKYGYREGSMKSKAAAMYGSKAGATLGEVKESLGSVQLNVLTELESKGHKVERVKEGGKGSRQVTRYFLQ